ncbi:signal peptidase I [Halopseudomonas sabulinigri]|uniref:Signal peptidase I n=1 Tax=Halopseudomonas sabulinigri TaxID=472181 RepID=A0A1H1UBY3_9GAMM|nr:signal peptidase I [Halopseudomonas sabulinigri]SDS69449.1 signal peptidase I [Halopseudomonas sabulinigri]
MATVRPPKIWIAVILGIFLQPFVFLYVNRPRLFWPYLLAALVVAAVDWYLVLGLHLLFSLICPLHACWIIRRGKSLQPRRWYSRVWVVIGFYLGLMLGVMLVRAFLYEPYAVPSASMHPTLVEGDVVIVQKWGFAQGALFGHALPGAEAVAPERLQRGEVYVFYPAERDELYVKRLMALPGDVIAITEHGVVINGERLTSQRLSDTDSLSLYAETAEGESYRIQYLKDAPPRETRTFRVPEGRYFFLGDNRDNSDDSRHWGSVPAERIVGEVVAVVPN